MSSQAAACKWEGPILHRVILEELRRNEINQSLLVYGVQGSWVGDVGWRDDRRTYRKARLGISMSSALLSSVWYWLVALGSVQVSTSPAGTGEERDGGGRRGGMETLLSNIEQRKGRAVSHTRRCWTPVYRGSLWEGWVKKGLSAAAVSLISAPLPRFWYWFQLPKTSYCSKLSAYTSVY